MSDQSQILTPAFENIAKLDSDYEKILELRKMISAENTLTQKFNTRLAQAHKSNWKLDTKDKSIVDELNLYEETINAEMTSIESCKEQVHYFKEENKQLLNEKKDNINEKLLNFEDKFLNAYNEYSEKNLLINIQEYREKAQKKRDKLKDVKQVEGNWHEKISVILENSNNEKLSTYVYNFILNEDNEVLTESQFMKRSVRDSNIKWQQNKETIQEFSNQKSKYNF